MVCEYFLPFGKLPFQFINCVLCCAEALQSDIVSFVYFSFLDCAFGVLSKKSLSRPMSTIFFPIFYYSFSSLTFESLIHFELIFVSSER